MAALVAFPNSLQAQNKFFATPNRGGVEGARGNAQIQMLLDQSTRMHACTAQGHLYAPSNSASDANGCLAQITIDGSNGNFTAQGLGTFSGGLTVNGATTLNGAILNGGNTIRDSGGGWVRTYGETGWYSQTHGGGFHMTDSTWVRVYGGKWLYSATGIRADGGGVRTNQICDVNGGNCVAQNALGGGGASSVRIATGAGSAWRWPSASASCNGNEQVTGGGGVCSGGSGDWRMPTNRPNGNGWYIGCDTSYGQSGTAYAYAICMKK